MDGITSQNSNSSPITNSVHIGPADANGVRYLYVVDSTAGRVLKYNYTNNQYIGWIGALNKSGSPPISMTGANTYALQQTLDGGGNYLSSSSVLSPSTLSADCSTAVSGSAVITPGWCQGGQPYTNPGASNLAGNGQLYYPRAVVDDGTYIYVINYQFTIVQRYISATGQFVGWIGRIQSNTGMTAGKDYTGTALATSAGCATALNNTITPGWCLGGIGYNTTDYIHGDGEVRNVTAITYAVDNSGIGYIYVGGVGMVARYNAQTGAFAGWIGYVSTKNNTNANSVTTTTLTNGPGATGCPSASASATTPGWCIGGQASNSNGYNTGGLNTVVGLSADVANNALYVIHNGGNGETLEKYNLSTGAWLSTPIYNGSPFSFYSAGKMDTDGTYLYIADRDRVIKIDKSGDFLGWIGKVKSNAGMSNAPGNTSSTCSSTANYSNTPGWCLAGTATSSLDEKAFNVVYGVTYDGNNNIVTVDTAGPGIRKWDTPTGNYQGMLTNTSNPINSWSISQHLASSFGGYDDYAFNLPEGSYADSTYLYVADSQNNRVKKVNLKTGATVGWIGGVGGFESGVTHLSTCGTNSVGITSGWCLGALPIPYIDYVNGFISSPVTDGLTNIPSGVTGDATAGSVATYLYVTDGNSNRILRYIAATGAYAGWIGGISGTPTSGPATNADGTVSSNSCSGASNTFTPGWCLGGGTSTSSTIAGSMSGPAGITFNNGNLYVTEMNNNRVSSYNASTGAFLGWIGRTNSTSGLTSTVGRSPATVTTGGYTYTNGWSTGGTSQASVQANSGNIDPGGGFLFYGSAGVAGIASDGTYLYVSNAYGCRIDKFNQTTGVYVSSTKIQYQNYTNTWTAGSNIANTWEFPGPLVYSNGYLYTGHVNAGQTVMKISTATGSTVGWMGAIASGSNTTGPVATSCVGATGVTPGWCQGGSTTTGFYLGNSNTVGGLVYPTGVSVDSNYIYVSDQALHRVIRYPK